MLTKKMGSLKKLAKKGKYSRGGRDQDHQEQLIKKYEEKSPVTKTTPTGFFAVYVGSERRRFVVPTRFLSHPLFKMLLEKAYQEFGFEQKSGLVVPCTVSAFQEVVNAVECCSSNFHFGEFVEELL